MFATANSAINRPHLYRERNDWKEAKILADLHTIDCNIQSDIAAILADSPAVLRCTNVDKLGSSIFMHITFTTYHALQRVIESFKKISDVTLEFSSEDSYAEELIA